MLNRELDMSESENSDMIGDVWVLLEGIMRGVWVTLELSLMCSIMLFSTSLFLLILNFLKNSSMLLTVEFGFDLKVASVMWENPYFCISFLSFTNSFS